MRAILRYWLGLLALVLACAPASAEVPAWLPRYALDIQLHLDQHVAVVRERVTWTNRHDCPTSELVFNNHAHFKLPDKDVGMTAKMAEILRLTPSDVLDLEGHACEIQTATLVGMTGPARIAEPRAANELPPPRIVMAAGSQRPFYYREDNETALVVPLPRPVAKDESVTVDLEFIFRLPQKMGRWGQWDGVTFLTNWLPVVAYYDEHGWQPTPYIPWHQPFFNEAGVYSARVTLPCAQKLACTGAVVEERDLGNGTREVTLVSSGARDFALVCSDRFREHVGEADQVRVRCLALPEHDYYARIMLKSACEAITTYNRWFGPYTAPEFTVVESFFGWNGNECGGLVMIDNRIFDMPHLAERYVDYLVSHETCHQWWYNVVGTNGYCETWMDEGLATYFSYRLMKCKYGKNDNLLELPQLLRWLPNIRREDYRHFGLYGTLGRAEESPTVQELPKFGHIVNLFSMCYDKGGRIVGMIEERLGEAAFLDFMHRVYRRYQFRILRVADFQRELEEYTGQSWDEFFQQWLYGKGMADWCVDKVEIENLSGTHGVMERLVPVPECLRGKRYHRRHGNVPCRVTVLLRQKAEYDEPTVLGIALEDDEHYDIRIPIIPQAGVLELADMRTCVESLGDHCVRVVLELPCRPIQIAVDPDQVVLDRNPSNNYWKTRCTARLTPLYTFLDETDLTCPYDSWSVAAGPWFYTPTYETPWFTRATMFGARAGLYRTQDFVGGLYAGYRTDYRDLVMGVDGLWDHFPWSHTQVGFIAERRLAAAMNADENAVRGVLYGRYIFDYGDSLYLPPFHYLESYTTYQDNLLPMPRDVVPGSQRYNLQTLGGLHYHINYLTPYWDAEGGFQFDATYASGLTQTLFDNVDLYSHQLFAQFSMVKYLPDWTGPLSQTRLAARLYGAVGLPDRIQYFPLGSGQLFRGYDLAQRQGSMVWVGSLEWRVPIARHLHWDCCDHVFGLRNIYSAFFYDVGDAYLKGHSIGGDVSHALGTGLRLDIAWFSFVERTILRFDTAKTINDNTPFQFWLGIEHPF